jgi:hypothetical protein
MTDQQVLPTSMKGQTMKTYIGTKIINAEPMTRQAYNDFRGWPLPADENGFDKGYLVEYTDGGKANTGAFRGYVSWSPKEQFDNAYRLTSGMSFGLAIDALKKGHRVARSGWNGRGMWLVLVPGTKLAQLKEGTPYATALSAANGSAVNACEILPHIDMYTTNAQGRRAMLPGWLASQTDMLSDDWEIIST